MSLHDDLILNWAFLDTVSQRSNMALWLAELEQWKTRAEAAEAALAAVPRNEIKQLYIATITPSDPERYANHRRVAKWLFPDSEVQP